MSVRRLRPAKLKTVAEAAAWYVEQATHEPGGCLTLAGRWGGWGYPRINWQGRGMPAAQFILEAKLGRELRGGSHAEREEVQRLCGNRECINPDHLELGDRAATIRRSSESQRRRTAKRVHLTEAQCAEVARRYADGEGAMRDFAEEFGVSVATIRRVVRQESPTC